LGSEGEKPLANRRLSMRKLKEMLRLHLEMRLSNRAIARAFRCRTRRSTTPWAGSRWKGCPGRCPRDWIKRPWRTCCSRAIRARLTAGLRNLTPPHGLLSQYHRRSSAIVVSDRPPENWYKLLANPVLAESILEYSCRVFRVRIRDPLASAVTYHLPRPYIFPRF